LLNNIKNVIVTCFKWKLSNDYMCTVFKKYSFRILIKINLLISEEVRQIPFYMMIFLKTNQEGRLIQLKLFHLNVPLVNLAMWNMYSQVKNFIERLQNAPVLFKKKKKIVR